MSSFQHLTYPGRADFIQVTKDMDPNGYVQVEPNGLQSSDFLKPCIIQACEGVVTVENQSENVIVVKKNSQPVHV